jgi:serine protease inhibitor
MRKLSLFILSIVSCGVLMFWISACRSAESANASNSPSPTPVQAETPLPEVAIPVVPQSTGNKPMDAKLAAADNEFGINLFNQLQKQDKDKNVFFSPLSVAFALAMTYNGASGETKQAMARALKFDGMNQEELNQASAALMSTLKSADPQIEFAIANSLWAKAGMKFNEAFLARNRQFFKAEIATLNFADPTAKNTINSWVSKNTNSKIPTIIDQIDAQKVLFLINAIYFKGQWQKKFDKALTKNEPFHLLGGSEKQVPMMSQSGKYQYHRGDKFQAVSLPYGQGSKNLYLFLPDEGASLTEFLKGLTYEKWEQWMRSFRNTPGEVKIPRFKLDYDRTLNDALKALGMEAAFSESRADFSGISDGQKLFISEVKHKAIVEVNEEGTEAAAATSVGISVTSAMPTQQPFRFIADRPFLMAIRNQQTGAILFLGAVMEPK